MKKIVLALALAAATSLGTAQAQTSALGWAADLAGSCWQGVNARGVQIDRQCFQLQFGRFLRGNVTRADGLNSSTVFGRNAERQRLEMYAWSNNNDPAVYTPEYDSNGVLAFAEVGGRVVWRRVDGDNFQIVRQRSDGRAWSDISVITYHRDGAAPAAFEAVGATVTSGSGGFGWLDQEAGHCVHQSEPQVNLHNRGCLSWEYPHVLRQTWYWGSQAASGETVMFKIGHNMRFFYWDAQGNFGQGASNFVSNALYSVKDASPNQRTSLRRVTDGFNSVTEVRDTESAGRPWTLSHSVRLKHD
ncbi:MAG: hypothetical protein QM759_00135 [Terricaulis sp.]